MKITPTVYYLHADGDSIGPGVERLLFNERLAELRDFSERLSAAITDTAMSLARQLVGEVIMAGGDDILLKFTPARYRRSIVLKAMETFAAGTGCSLSIGVGKTTLEAYINLRRAKSEGGGILIDSPPKEISSE